MSDEFTRLGASLDRVVGGLGARSAMLELHSRWAEIVGEGIAEHCRPRRVEDRQLLVEVDHPGWATEIRYLEHGIIERLAELMPDAGIESMRVSVGRNR